MGASENANPEKEQGGAASSDNESPEAITGLTTSAATQNLTPSGYCIIPTTVQQDNANPLQFAEYAGTQDQNGNTFCVFAVTNTGNESILLARVDVVIRAQDGSIVDKAGLTFPRIQPGETQWWAQRMYPSDTPDSIEIRALDPSGYVGVIPTTQPSSYRVFNLSTSTDSFGIYTTVSGEVSCTHDDQIAPEYNPEVVVVVRDTDGTIIAGGREYLRILSEGDTDAFECLLPALPEGVSVEGYARI